MMSRVLLLCLLHGFTALSLSAKEHEKSVIQSKGLTVRLVSETAAIQPDRPFYAGLWITHAPGYHTYWKNPGLAGVPTRLDWQLPEGFTAGPALWEPPDKVKMATYNTHGYERDVLLAWKITPPEKLETGTVTISGKASWMACARDCNPGFATLSLSLPVNAPASPAPTETEWAAKFAALRAVQPPNAEGWNFTAVRKKNHITLTAYPAPDSKAPLPANPQFFSEDNLICSHPVQPWQQDGSGGWRCVLTMSEFPPEDRSRLRGLLFSKSGWHPGGGAPYVRINVPVTSETPVMENSGP